MSPVVGNFVHDLVEMAKAMETLPLVQEELARIQSERDGLHDIIQRLELRIMDQKSEIDTLHAKVREAEVSRDDAELRFLEADDHLIAFRRLVNAFSSDATALMRAMEPEPKPVPTSEPMVAFSPETTTAGSDPSPVPEVATQSPTPEPLAPSISQDSSASAEPVRDASVETGQGATDPIPTAGDSQDAPQTATVSGSPTTESSSASEPPPVSYADEPKPMYSPDWYHWASRMDEHYGWSGWPSRNVA